MAGASLYRCVKQYHLHAPYAFASVREGIWPKTSVVGRSRALRQHLRVVQSGAGPLGQAPDAEQQRRTSACKQSGLAGGAGKSLYGLAEGIRHGMCSLELGTVLQHPAARGSLNSRFSSAPLFQPLGVL